MWTPRLMSYRSKNGTTSFYGRILRIRPMLINTVVVGYAPWILSMFAVGSEFEIISFINHIVGQLLLTTLAIALRLDATFVKWMNGLTKWRKRLDNERGERHPVGLVSLVYDHHMQFKHQSMDSIWEICENVECGKMMQYVNVWTVYNILVVECN
ncbi:hypothetical protein VTP01DRAFT_5533 [Rhizomucor pusillus]|uniref:uncharacterized protein n=1 Tax=Rhizomucor pusillus TaxID=4840 RepID=UPI0037444338